MKPLTIQGYGCDECPRTFDDLEDLVGHEDPDGEPCDGGIPA